MMYVVVAHIIETLTSSRLEDVISRGILEPLGMKSTFFSTKDASNATEDFATGYVYSNGSFQEVPDFDLSKVSGAGFIISNVLDYVTWLRCLISRSAPLSKAGHEAIRAPRAFVPSDSGDNDLPWGSYTLGWITGTYDGHHWFMHSGGMEAYSANVIFFPELKYGSLI